MPKYRSKSIVIDAVQWFKNGDHPQDGHERFIDGFAGELYEGKVVRYFQHPRVPGKSICSKCYKPFHVHGWIDTLGGGHIVCPGDWIITDVKGEHYPCKDEIFKMTYESDVFPTRVGMNRNMNEADRSEEGKPYKWEIWPHPDTTRYDYLGTNSDAEALEAILRGAERHLWDENDGGERILKVIHNPHAIQED